MEGSVIQADLSAARLRTAEIEPLDDRIVVEQAPEATNQQTEGGIYVPETVQEKPHMGVVLAVGTGRVFDNGEVRPLKVSVGDHIVFGRYAGVELPKELGENLLMMREDEVLGVLRFSPAPMPPAGVGIVRDGDALPVPHGFNEESAAA